MKRLAWFVLGAGLVVAPAARADDDPAPTTVDTQGVGPRDITHVQTRDDVSSTSVGEVVEQTTPGVDIQQPASPPPAPAAPASSPAAAVPGPTPVASPLPSPAPSSSLPSSSSSSVTLPSFSSSSSSPF